MVHVWRSEDLGDLCDTGEKETDSLLSKLPRTPVCTSHFPIVTVNLQKQEPEPSFTGSLRTHTRALTRAWHVLYPISRSLNPRKKIMLYIRFCITETKDATNC